jgi:4-hydroxy-tetrahydrodipicolinate reductase
MESRAQVRVVVSGATGRMGQALARLAAEEGSGIEIIGGVARASYESQWAGEIGYPVVEAADTCEWLLREAEVVVDFSSPQLFRTVVGRHAALLRGKGLVVGTTGLEEEDHRLLGDAARHSPVLPAANFSPGVNLLVELVQRAARALGPDYDAEIVEAHHRRKVDAPSGTALHLGEAVARGHGSALGEVRRDGRSGQAGERPRGQIGFHAVRGGDVVGDHRVLFLGERERLELAHSAGDRSVFADGALRAALWVHGRAPGLYSMRDLLGLG